MKILICISGVQWQDQDKLVYSPFGKHLQFLHCSPTAQNWSALGLWSSHSQSEHELCHDGNTNVINQLPAGRH